jgi:hypothetical protein
LFEVETQSDDDAKQIASILTQKYHCIGRSKAAQYGTVLIEEQSFSQIHSCQQQVFNNKGEQIVIVYADSRLVFLDEYGQCTFRPTAGQLGVEGGEIDWGLTQVRTFCYMPWNSNRQTQEADISGFEKGSTFVINQEPNIPNPTNPMSAITHKMVSDMSSIILISCLHAKKPTGKHAIKLAKLVQ